MKDVKSILNELAPITTNMGVVNLNDFPARVAWHIIEKYPDSSLKVWKKHWYIRTKTDIPLSFELKEQIERLIKKPVRVKEIGEYIFIEWEHAVLFIRTFKFVEHGKTIHVLVDIFGFVYKLDYLLTLIKIKEKLFKEKSHELTLELVYMSQDGEILTDEWQYFPRYSFEDIKEFYFHIPDIEKTLDFLDAPERLVYFLGEPGMGKTRLIEGLLASWQKKYDMAKQNIGYITQSKILLNSSFWNEFRHDLLIVDDADVLLRTKRDGEVFEVSAMADLLRLSDGLIYDYAPHIIFISNLPVINIDRALLREGRVFGYYEFEPYTPPMLDRVVPTVARFLGVKDEKTIQVVLEKLKQQGTITLAKIFAMFKNNLVFVPTRRIDKRRRVGFKIMDTLSLKNEPV